MTAEVQATAVGSATVAEPEVAVAQVIALERANLAVVEVAGALFKASIAAAVRRAAPASAAAPAGEASAEVGVLGVEVVGEVEGAVGGGDKQMGFGCQVQQDRKLWNVGKWNDGTLEFWKHPIFDYSKIL